MITEQEARAKVVGTGMDPRNITTLEIKEDNTWS